MLNQTLPIVIAGGGPAGSSLAIRLAQKGHPVVLVEREHFPRQKLCGEFISPECLEHFDRLGVLDKMLAFGGDRITETVFYDPAGRSVTVNSEWFGARIAALSLSRAVMDDQLLRRAREVGAAVYEGSTIAGLNIENGEIAGVTIKTGGDSIDIRCSLVVDATGRSKAVSKMASRLPGARQSTKDRKPRLVCYKAHVSGAKIESGRCEIYFFPGGYGGLSNIENGMANHCFMVRSEVAKCYGIADEIVTNVIFKNSRARQMLASATPAGEWLAVSVTDFGISELNPFPRLLTVGDAAAFIDPFTGSGMLLSLESSEILSQCIDEHLSEPAEIARDYRSRCAHSFAQRMRICRVLRYGAFSPFVTSTAIRLLSCSDALRARLARSTRSSRRIGTTNL